MFRLSVTILSDCTFAQINHLTFLSYPLCSKTVLSSSVCGLYRCAGKSLARPGRKQATASEDFEFHISYL